MRQLSLQEVSVVSGAEGTDIALKDLTINDVLKWASAYLAGTTAWTHGSGLAASHALNIPYVGVNATMGLAGVGSGAAAIAGYALGHFLGDLFNNQVAARVGG